MNNGLFSSECDTWATPPELFRRLDAEFRFTLDVCALPENTKCERFFTPNDDGLIQPWDGVCWMNPPYGSAISMWMKKAYTEFLERRLTIVCLIPARTDTKWWHDYAMKGEIRFIRRRIRFVGGKSCAPFPSAIVIYRDRWWEGE